MFHHVKDVTLRACLFLFSLIQQSCQGDSRENHHEDIKNITKQTGGHAGGHHGGSGGGSGGGTGGGEGEEPVWAWLPPVVLLGLIIMAVSVYSVYKTWTKLNRIK